jgi:hypothetical protein
MIQAQNIDFRISRLAGMKIFSILSGDRYYSYNELRFCSSRYTFAHAFR